MPTLIEGNIHYIRIDIVDDFDIEVIFDAFNIAPKLGYPKIFIEMKKQRLGINHNITIFNTQDNFQTQTSINVVSSNNPSLVLLDPSPLAQQPPPPPPPPQPPIVAPLPGDPTLVVVTAQNSQGSNGVDRNAKVS